MSWAIASSRSLPFRGLKGSGLYVNNCSHCLSSSSSEIPIKSSSPKAQGTSSNTILLICWSSSDGSSYWTRDYLFCTFSFSKRSRSNFSWMALFLSSFSIWIYLSSQSFLACSFSSIYLYSSSSLARFSNNFWCSSSFCYLSFANYSSSSFLASSTFLFSSSIFRSSEVLDWISTSWSSNSSGSDFLSS